MDKNAPPPLFRLFTEIGIISQLSSKALEKRLPDGMLISHFSVLNHLTRVRDGQTPLALASAFQVPKTTMTHTLSGLERNALIDMRSNPEDGRSKCVWITEAGRAFRETAVMSISEDFTDMTARFPPAEIEALLPKLAEIREYLDNARNADSK